VERAARLQKGKQERTEHVQLAARKSSSCTYSSALLALVRLVSSPSDGDDVDPLGGRLRGTKAEGENTEEEAKLASQ